MNKDDKPSKQLLLDGSLELTSVGRAADLKPTYFRRVMYTVLAVLRNAPIFQLANVGWLL